MIFFGFSVSNWDSMHFTWNFFELPFLVFLYPYYILNYSNSYLGKLHISKCFYVLLNLDAIMKEVSKVSLAKNFLASESLIKCLQNH